MRPPTVRPTLAAVALATLALAAGIHAGGTVAAVAEPLPARLGPPLAPPGGELARAVFAAG